MIMWWVRIPELLAALIAGATLALAGAAMQSLMRNDLADPYLMGVASGGGVGAALALSLGLINLLGLWILPMMSFGGALLASVWIELYARRLDARNGSL
jgi:iron complex transport system permease protein